MSKNSLSERYRQNLWKPKDSKDSDDWKKEDPQNQVVLQKKKVYK